jgi:NTE family protein
MLYQTDDFQSIGYRIEERGGRRALVIEPVEKEWGPNYFQFGTNLSTDLRSGDSAFSLQVAHRATWLNSRGLELRSVATIGRVTGIGSELYQPLDAQRSWFVAPYASARQSRDNLYFDEDPVSTYRVRTAVAGVDVGRNFSNTAVIRLGVERGTTRAEPDVATPLFPAGRADIGAMRVVAVYDKLDNWIFPERGVYAYGEARASRRGLGADGDYERVEGAADVAFGSGAHRWTAGLRGGRSWGAAPPVFDQFTLGGFQRLSGYQTGQFVGPRYGLARLLYTHRVNVLGLKGTHVGGSIEAGNVYGRINGPQSGGARAASSLFFAYDSPVGPLALGAGFAEGGSYALYLFLGRP